MRSLQSLISGGDHASRQQVGYSYVSAEEPAEFRDAAPGRTVGTSIDRPPWIVVDLSLSSIVVGSWPGRLWEVQVLRRAAEQPRAGAGYVRATAVRVARELPTASLFGRNGRDIEQVFRQALQLTLAQRSLLAERSDPAAIGVFSAAWNRWLAEVDPANPHRNQDHRDTLAVFAALQRSPVGSAFAVLHAVTTKRARSLDGAAAFIVSAEEHAFVPAWGIAFSALLHACMALGADSSLLSDNERSVLLAGYAAIQPSSRY